jgi:hypothetical protein
MNQISLRSTVSRVGSSALRAYQFLLSQKRHDLAKRLKRSAAPLPTCKQTQIHVHVDTHAPSSELLTDTAHDGSSAGSRPR